MLTKYEDVFNTLTDTATFSSVDGAAIPPQPFQFIPEDIDPPRHRSYRKVVNAALAPQAGKLAPHNIRVNSIRPTAVSTPMVINEFFGK